MKHLLLLMLAMFFAFGCMKSKEKDIVSAGKISSDFYGTWEGCFIDSSDSIKIRQTISTYTVIHSETFYENNTACLNANKIVNIESVNGITRESPLTLKMTSTTMTPLTSTMATTFNNNFMCLYQQWASGIPRDVTGWVCTSDLDFSDVTPFAVYYTRNGANLTVSDGEGSQFQLTLVP